MYNVCVADTDSDSSSDSEADDVKASPANVAKVLFDYYEILFLFSNLLIFIVWLRVLL